MIFLKFVLDFFKGIALGAGAILPGISSGVLSVIFGIYDKLLDSVLNFFKNIKENFKFLFPIFLGLFFGVVLLGNTLKLLFLAYPIQTKFIFIGLILGCIPSLISECTSKYSFKFSYLFFTIISAFIGFLCVVLEKKIPSSSSSSYSFLFLSICGFFMSAGVVIPGVSSTLILMLFGVYTSYINAVSTVYIPFLFPLGIGLFLGNIVFIKLTKYLLDNFYPQTFFSIIGFTMGSIFVLYPRF